MAEPNIGQNVASAYERRFPGRPTDNIFNSRATVKALGEKGFKEQASGGRLIEAGIEYAENTTHAMQAATDVIDTTMIPVFDAFRVDWKTCAGTVAYSYQQMFQTQGDDAKFDLVASLIENGRDSHLATLNRELWITGTPGANQFNAIPNWINEAPTTGIVGGINRALFTFARNRATSGTNSGTAFNQLRAALTTNYNLCSLGGLQRTPTACITSRAVFEGLEGTMTSNIRYMSEDQKKAGDPSFMNDALKFKGKPVFYDEDAIADDARWINNDVLKFVYLKWMKLDGAVDPANQLLNVHKLYTIGNLIAKAPRHLGVVYDIT